MRSAYRAARGSRTATTRCSGGRERTDDRTTLVKKTTWDIRKKRAYQKRWNENPLNKAKKKLYDQTRRHGRRKKEMTRLRGQLLSAYGPRCACCGETKERFLTLDHVHNNGSDERKRMDRATIYRRALRNQSTGEYQILCWNCQRGKYMNGGVCPHKCKETGTSGESDPLRGGVIPS